MPPRYAPPDNDNLTASFDAAGLVPAGAAGSDRFIDLVSWNLYWFDADGASRVGRVTDILDALNADIFVFQEVAPGSLDAVMNELRVRGAGDYDIAYGTTGGQQRVAIAWDRDWIRTKDDVAELVAKGAVVTADGKNVFPRSPLRAYFSARTSRPDATGLSFQLVGVHLKSQRAARDDPDNGTTQRRDAAAWLARWLIREAPDTDNDVIVTGDWNEPPDSETWAELHDLERAGKLRFRAINDPSDFSHLYYRSLGNIGSRLDVTLISSDTKPDVKQDPSVVRWTPLQALLEANPKAGQLKALIKNLKAQVSDHLPVVSRFYFTDARRR